MKNRENIKTGNQFLYILNTFSSNLFFICIGFSHMFANYSEQLKHFNIPDFILGRTFTQVYFKNQARYLPELPSYSNGLSHQKLSKLLVFVSSQHRLVL